MASQMCIQCGKRPKYQDGQKLHPYCGRTCASAAKSGTSQPNAPQTAPILIGAYPTCQCGMPVWIDPSGGYSQWCSRTCKNLSQSGFVQNVQPVNNPNICFHCKVKAQQPSGLFCGRTCFNQAISNGPGILEIPRGHPNFQDVANQFKSAWKHTPTPKQAKHVYLILVNAAQKARYDVYRASVEARGQFTAKNLSAGNERRRWHGTTRSCLIGDSGKTAFCSSTTCSLCCILKTSFDLRFYKKKTSWGRFGKGLYTSSTSSKSDSYSLNETASPMKAMILSKVVVGKGQKVVQDDTTRQHPDAGYDSVLGEPGTSGNLNYDECVVYTNDAIIPAYLVIYQ